MKFGDYADKWTTAKRFHRPYKGHPDTAWVWQDSDTFYNEYGHVMRDSLENREARAKRNNQPYDKLRDRYEVAVMLECERYWWKANRPYFNCWPSLLPALGRLRLEKIPLGTFTSPVVPMVELRFPEGHFQHIRAAFVGLHMHDSPRSRERYGGAIASLVTSACLYKTDENGSQVTDYSVTTIYPRDAAECMPMDFECEPAVQDSLEEATQVHRIAMAAILLQRNPDLLTPELLADDRHKWDTASASERARLADKANRRRGRTGFDLGKICEQSPHWRNAHMALFWTGQGRKVPLIQLRSGSMIHRKKFEQVPTGHRDIDLEQDHDHE